MVGAQTLLRNLCCTTSAWDDSNEQDRMGVASGCSPGPVQIAQVQVGIRSSRGQGATREQGVWKNSHGVNITVTTFETHSSIY